MPPKDIRDKWRVNTGDRLVLIRDGGRAVTAELATT